jgi:hypothetical protein
MTMKTRPILLLLMVALAPLFAAPAQAQVSPDDIARIAKAVHDAEGHDLGVRSTRDSRNAFWARVVAIVHFGHPTFNRTPDPRWCLKDGGSGRPQSDDVAALCATREFWDFIGCAGCERYDFRAGAHPGEILPPVQNVYPPTRSMCPDCGASAPTPPVTSPPTPPPGPAPPPVSIDTSAIVAHLHAVVEQLHAIAEQQRYANERLAAIEASTGAAAAVAGNLVADGSWLPQFLEAVKAVESTLRGGIPVRVRF